MNTNNPPEIRIRLGQLIADPRKPDEYLGDGPLPPGPKDTKIAGRMEERIIYDSKNARNVDLGFSASVLSTLPFKLGGDKQKSNDSRLEINSAEEQLFVPSDTYVLNSIKQPKVLRALAESGYSKSVFMLVGLKIASAGSITHEMKRGGGGGFDVTVPGAIIGGSVHVGAEAKINMTSGVLQKKTVSYPFVFAYRLREIRYLLSKNGFNLKYCLHQRRDNARARQ